jgi:hypothetical protein
MQFGAFFREQLLNINSETLILQYSSSVHCVNEKYAEMQKYCNHLERLEGLRGWYSGYTTSKINLLYMEVNKFKEAIDGQRR